MGRPERLTSVRARLAAGHEVAVTSLLPGTVYVTRTPCCGRLLQVTESEFERGDRQVTVRCPGCSAIWQTRSYAPVVHWDQ